MLMFTKIGQASYKRIEIEEKEDLKMAGLPPVWMTLSGRKSKLKLKNCPFHINLSETSLSISYDCYRRKPETRDPACLSACPSETKRRWVAIAKAGSH